MTILVDGRFDFDLIWKNRFLSGLIFPVNIFFMKHILHFILLACFASCSRSTDTEKYQNHDSNIIDVRELVKEIVIDTPIIGGWARPFIVNDYLLISDHQSEDKLISIFNKRNYSYLMGVGDAGEGPDEITTIGVIVPDEVHHQFFVPDHGKLKILNYNLDSVFRNPFYKPTLKVNMQKKQFPDRFIFVNDSLCFARSILVGESVYFQQSLVKWNLLTGTMSLLVKGHPEIERKRSQFAVSLEHNLIVDCYTHHDLMTIHDLEGNLKYNVYGPRWDSRTSNDMIYYGAVTICKDRIVAAYAGGENWSDAGFLTCFQVYDLNGNYIKTLQVGRKIYNFCYDKELNRLIMTLNDEMQFAYLDLDGLLE